MAQFLYSAKVTQNLRLNAWKKHIFSHASDMAQNCCTYKAVFSNLVTKNTICFENENLNAVSILQPECDSIILIKLTCLLKVTNSSSWFLKYKYETMKTVDILIVNFHAKLMSYLTLVQHELF